MSLSPAAECIFQYHKAKGVPANAASLIGSPGIPDQAALSFIYKELLGAGIVEQVVGKIGRAKSAPHDFRALYRCK
jgi:hypothetical protein